MKKAIAIILMISLIVTASGCGADEPGAMRRRLGRPWHHHESDEAEEDETDEYEGMHIKLSVTDEGYDVFTPGKDINFDYRYGPSILLEDDGGIDAWFSSPADGGELDWITYRHSDDNGKTWSNEKVVLSPDPGSRDALSVCDPDVFYHGGYYYMGYTSTIDDTKQGLANSVFLARSSRPDGPYEKWDGEGWGGDPEPMIYYDGVWSGWGRGEPSFVVVEDTVYVYSTMDSYSNDDERIKSTEVRTADINEEDWPANLEFAGYALIRTDGPDDEGYEYDDCDSLDVAYLEESGRFLAVCTNRRLSDESCILYFESDDGRYFERVAELNDNICCGCHNAGIMSDGLGHIGEDDPVLIGYAYSGADNDVWGTWATRFAPVSVEYTEELDRSEDGKENLTLAFEYRGRMEDPEPIFITADGVSGYARSGGGKFSIDYRWVDSDKNSHRIDASELTFNKYDGNMKWSHNREKRRADCCLRKLCGADQETEALFPVGGSIFQQRLLRRCRGSCIAGPGIHGVYVQTVRSVYQTHNQVQ